MCLKMAAWLDEPKYPGLGYRLRRGSNDGEGSGDRTLGSSEFSWPFFRMVVWGTVSNDDEHWGIRYYALRRPTIVRTSVSRPAAA